jgi:hypothetical protein
MSFDTRSPARSSGSVRSKQSLMWSGSCGWRCHLLKRCDGVPFYIEQVVAGLTETGVPETLYEPLFARLRASTNVVPVVEAAAVIGRATSTAPCCVLSSI